MAANGFDDDQTRSFTNLAVGTIVSHYKIISKIGAGGMGEVYLAEDTQLDRRVALKFLPSHLSQDEAARARFTREAKAAAKLDHPNIVPVYEVGEFQDRPFFAMAHIEGKSLKEVINAGRLSINEAIEFTKQICEGLHEAHSAGIIHRDIKPGNIIIDSKGKTRILDFGLAIVAGEDKLTKTGSTLGTVGYMSPEQIEGKQVDHRSDLFSVGVILYEMLTGRRPFEGDTDAAVARSITDATPEPIARYKSGTTGELQQIVEKALTKDPALRYQHADGMLADLKRLSIDSGATKKRRIGLVVAAAIVIAMVVGYFGFSTFHGEYDQVTGPKRLVVLPFDNLGDDDQDYFASGMTDEVIARLSEVSGLSVASRLTAARLKEAGIDLKKIGDSLGAEYVLDASARYQIGSDGTRHVRLITQLINVTEDRVIWSQTYDTVMTEVFSVQASIAEQVSEKMNVILLEPEREQVWKRWTTSQEAYDYYLQGNRYIGSAGGFGPLRDFQLGIEMFRKAIALDSNFSRAYSQMSYAYSMHCDRGACTDSIKQAALYTARRAIDTDPEGRNGYIALAWYYFLGERDAPKAQAQIDKAYEDNRENSYYLTLSHIFLRSMGEFDEAISRQKRALEARPNEVFSIYALGQTCLRCRRYEEAEELFDRVINMRPDFYGAYYQKVLLYLNQQGDIGKAREVIESSYGKVDSARWRGTLRWLDMKEGKLEQYLAQITIPPYDTVGYFFNRGQTYWRMGEMETMRAYLDSALNQVQRRLGEEPENAGLHSMLGLIYAGLERKDEAIAEGLRATEIAPYEKDTWYNFGYLDWLLGIYIVLNEKELALEQLEKMLTVPNTFGLSHVFIDPDYAPLLNYPGFERLVEKYGNEYAKSRWKDHKNKSI
ncbi:MAG: protein kinase, partial [Candidatus Zixiibacteriota bacterium]